MGTENILMDLQFSSKLKKVYYVQDTSLVDHGFSVYVWKK